MLEWLKKQTGKQLLEVGCGMGIDSGYFSKNNFIVTGIDLAESHIQLAKEYFRFKGLNGSFELGDAEKLPYQDQAFDCLYSFGVMHHTETPQNAIDEAFRVLKPGGRCFIMLYSKWSLNNLVHKILQIPYDNIHERRPFGKDANFVYRYSKQEVSSMFDQFSQVRVESEYLYGAGWGKVYDLTPKYLYHLFSKMVGWHLVIYAIK